MKHRVVLKPSDEGGFTVYVPSLPGCISEGDTEDEALANIREAIAVYLDEPTPTVELVIETDAERRARFKETVEKIVDKYSAVLERLAKYRTNTLLAPLAEDPLG
jgi:predicted RNase H-like HicB family nuclease